jgi:pimeloyl-ACP methyl ester carboxylesterase
VHILCYETFISRTDPAVLLLAGGSGPMLFWEEGFASASPTVTVLSFGMTFATLDPRSTKPGTRKYTLHDLAGDALGLFDSLGVTKVNLAK